MGEKRIIGWIAIVFVLTACALAAQPVWAARAEKLYEQGLLKESGERDPESALDLFRQAADGAGARNPALAADARLHMARCLEKLGRDDEALGLYLVITQSPEGTSAATLQAAQTEAERIQAQKKRAAEQAKLEAAARSHQMVLVREFHETRFIVLAGPGWARSGNHPVPIVPLALRYRLSPANRPLHLWAELGGLLPFGSVSQAIGGATLKLRHQVSIALVGELPHGGQRKIIPELGFGAAMTSSQIDAEPAGSETQNTWSPRLSAGLHFMPERIISWRLEASYTANPYRQSIESHSAVPTQSFDAPTSLWTLSAKVQFKIGWMSPILREKP